MEVSQEEVLRTLKAQAENLRARYETIKRVVDDLETLTNTGVEFQKIDKRTKAWRRLRQTNNAQV